MTPPSLPDVHRLAPLAHPVAILTGTTASGKTAAALALARRHGNLEVVNADSLLVYRGFDLGTAKPTRAELAEIPHHLVDVREPREAFTAGDFVRDCDAAIRDVHARGKRALIVGGTGFYLKALVYGLWEAPKSSPDLRARVEELSSAELHARLAAVDAESAARIAIGDRYRLVRAWETYEATGRTPTELATEASARGSVPGLSLLVTDREPAELRERIAARTQAMLDAGFLDEVRALVARDPEARPLTAVGYAQCTAYLRGEAPAGRRIAEGEAGLAAEIRLATEQLAKRQRTFLKGQFPDLAEDPARYGFFVLDRDADALRGRLASIYGE